MPNKEIIISFFYLILLILMFKNISKENKNKIYIYIVFVALLTPYNIMISRIHDYNESYFFNFLWRYKFFGLTLLDTYFMVYFFLNFKRIIKIFLKSPITRIILLKDFIYILLGIVFYILTKSYFLDSGVKLISNIRVIFYFYSTYFIFFSLRREEKIKESYFVMLLLFSILSLSLCFRNQIWIRHGYRVTILSQEWAVGILPFYATYLFFQFLKRKKINQFLKFSIVSLIIFFNFYKYNMIYGVYILFFTIYFYNRKYKVLKLLMGILIITSLLYTLNFIFKAKSIATREIQIEEYFDYLEEKGNITYFTGLGIGAPYKQSGKNKDDFGEIKKIDVQKNKAYKFAIQVPILNLHKDSGIIGVLIVLLSNFIIFFKILKKYLKSHTNKIFRNPEYQALTIFLSFSLLTLNNWSLIGTIPLSMLFAVLLARYNRIIERG